MQIPSDMSLALLNVGTAVLVKDVMDQHLRTIGDIKTYYASNLRFALEAYSDKHLDLIFCELSFEGGTAEELIRQIGGLDITDRVYVVLATEEDIEQSRALQEELCIDAILQEPFSTHDVEGQIARAVEKKTKKMDPWVDDLLEAKLAHKNKRMQEAQSLFLDILKSQKENIDVLLPATKFYLEVQKLEHAERLLDVVLEKNPFSLRALSLKSELLLKQGKYGEAIDILQGLTEQSPLNTNRANSIVSAYMQHGLDAIGRSQRVAGMNSLTNLNCLRLLVCLGKYKETVSTYERFRTSFLGTEKKEAEYFVAIAKKLGGLA